MASRSVLRNLGARVRSYSSVAAKEHVPFLERHPYAEGFPTLPSEVEYAGVTAIIPVAIATLAVGAAVYHAVRNVKIFGGVLGDGGGTERLPPPPRRRDGRREKSRGATRRGLRRACPPPFPRPDTHPPRPIPGEGRCLYTCCSSLRGGLLLVCSRNGVTLQAVRPGPSGAPCSTWLVPARAALTRVFPCPSRFLGTHPITDNKKWEAASFELEGRKVGCLKPCPRARCLTISAVNRGEFPVLTPSSSRLSFLSASRGRP